MKTEENSGGTSSSPNGENPSSSNSTNKGNPSKIAQLAKKVGLWLLFLIIGALAVTLALYLPTRSQLNQAQEEIERLEEIEQQYNELLPRFELAQAQTLVYKTISDTILLREALEDDDTTRASQQVRYLEDDLNELTIDEYPEILQRLQGQFSAIRSAAPGNADQALVELEVFYNDLLLLADNLE